MAIIYYRYDPATTAGFPPSFFHRMTHLYCPACGGQRAAHQLLHGHWLAALHDNALLCLAIPLLTWEWIAKKTRRLPAVLHRRVAGWIIVWTVIIFWVARNVPAWPATLLKPMEQPGNRCCVDELQRTLRFSSAFASGASVASLLLRRSQNHQATPIRKITVLRIWPMVSQSHAI